MTNKRDSVRVLSCLDLGSVLISNWAIRAAKIIRGVC